MLDWLFNRNPKFTPHEWHLLLRGLDVYVAEQVGRQSDIDPATDPDLYALYEDNIAQAVTLRSKLLDQIGNPGS